MKDIIKVNKHYNIFWNNMGITKKKKSILHMGHKELLYTTTQSAIKLN